MENVANSENKAYLPSGAGRQSSSGVQSKSKDKPTKDLWECLLKDGFATEEEYRTLGIRGSKMAERLLQCPEIRGVLAPGRNFREVANISSGIGAMISNDCNFSDTEVCLVIREHAQRGRFSEQMATAVLNAVSNGVLEGLRPYDNRGEYNTYKDFWGLLDYRNKFRNK